MCAFCSWFTTMYNTTCFRTKFSTFHLVHSFIFLLFVTGGWLSLKWNADTAGKEGVEFWRVNNREVYIEWLLRQLVIMVHFLSKVEMEQPRLTRVFDSVISFLNDVPLPWKLLCQRERKKARKLRRSVSPRRSVVRRWSTFCRLSPERAAKRAASCADRTLERKF